ncbi:phosphoribosylanthranilate isomerase [Salarchaeum sp. JOR-1]|uniref:phosphoribosylanthranilate isomerase n=1 Tax=Salarchaeum sp. JOR-1 TaxID=2599399 RepID=UPI00119851F2|nr:phosphoribosylanthranilate isomerase [Salarchaeum sp. JOR-1]QDX40596.1 phosphoribosylanthranilate isomerase [Salarchaeum sp. JOR-1]
MTRVKVCGITNEADAAAAVDAGADALGFIVDVPVDTPRELDPERAAALAASVPPFVTTVLVTMPDAPDDAADLAARVRPDVLQVHGDVPATDLAALADGVDAKLVKTVDADSPEDAARYDDAADALLVDSTDASGAGGTGRTHDWTVTRDLAARLDSPIVLAGGLTPDNVAEAVETVRPFAVDVASGVEESGGVKDHDAVAAFVAAAKHADGVVA